MVKRATHNQERIDKAINYIGKYFERHHYWPSIDDIAEHLKCQWITAKGCLSDAILAKYIKRATGKNRAYILTSKGWELIGKRLVIESLDLTK